MSRIRLALIAAALATPALFSACSTLPAAPVSVTDSLARTPELSTLSRLVGEAGLADTLRGAGPFTVFAPSNAAFAALPAKTLEDLGRNKEQLKAVLTYHVVASRAMAADVKPASVKSVQGANLLLGKAGSTVTVEDALVLKADLVATNGVIHVVDQVLMPPKR